MKVEDIKNGYCTQFLVNKNEGASSDKLRAFLESNGDSVVVIEDDEVINCHVHTADPGKIVSHALQYGYLTNFKIENMHEQFLARQAQGEGLRKAGRRRGRGYGQRVHLRRCGPRPGVRLRGRRRRRGPQGHLHRPWR